MGDSEDIPSSIVELNMSWFVPKMMLEIAAAGRVESIVEAVVAAAHTGKIGDGKIFVSSRRGCAYEPVKRVLRPSSAAGCIRQGYNLFNGIWESDNFLTTLVRCRMPPSGLNQIALPASAAPNTSF